MMKLEICSLYDGFESNEIPKSLADVTGLMFSSKKLKLKIYL